jgi:hypothetical protein
LHIPLGFDSNDNIEVIITGEFPDMCHQQPFGEVKVAGQKIAIHLKAFYVSHNEACSKTIEPYMVTIPLGKLSEGTYVVTINPGQKTKKENILHISKPHSQNIDNFPYAHVTHVTKTPNRAAISIEGMHSSSCVEIDRIETLWNATGDTIAVLPIIKKTSAHCDRSVKAFLYEVPAPRTEGIVFHVRTHEGRAINLQW